MGCRENTCNVVISAIGRVKVGVVARPIDTQLRSLWHRVDIGPGYEIAALVANIGDRKQRAAWDLPLNREIVRVGAGHLAFVWHGRVQPRRRSRGHN